MPWIPQTIITPAVPGSTGLFDAYALLQDQKAQNTDGGTFTSGAWQTRTLNTEVSDSQGFVALASNQFTVAAGSYVIRATAPAWEVSQNQTRLRNITAGTTVQMGSSEYNPTGNHPQTTSTLISRVTVTVATTFELQHQCGTTRATLGFGVAANQGTEVYAQVEIWREAAGDANAVTDPVEAIFGTPDTAFEFNTSSLSGLTALSPTPDVENADTSVPGAYFLRDDASGVSLCGRYIAATAPFTAITLLLDANPRADFHGAGIFIGEATPGVMNSVTLGYNSGRRLATDVWTNPTTYSSTPNVDATNIEPPIYFAIRANSTSNVDFIASYNGRVWWAVTTARNPSITVGSAGIFLKSISTTPFSAAFDYLRVWNSAKTFPGIP